MLKRDPRVAKNLNWPEELLRSCEEFAYHLEQVADEAMSEDNRLAAVELLGKYTDSITEVANLVSDDELVYMSFRYVAMIFVQLLRAQCRMSDMLKDKSRDPAERGLFTVRELEKSYVMSAMMIVHMTAAYLKQDNDQQRAELVRLLPVSDKDFGIN